MTKLHEIPGFRKIKFDKLLTVIYSSGYKSKQMKNAINFTGVGDQETSISGIN